MGSGKARPWGKPDITGGVGSRGGGVLLITPPYGDEAGISTGSSEIGSFRKKL